MRRTFLRIVCSVAIGCIVASVALSQGRGRGIGLGRKSDVFVNSHDARVGRLDGRGPRMNRVGLRNRAFIARGSRVRFNRNFDRDEFRQRERLNRLEMLRQERIAERRRFGRRP
jgi:hypothetical protein